MRLNSIQLIPFMEINPTVLSEACSCTKVCMITALQYNPGVFSSEVSPIEFNWSYSQVSLYRIAVLSYKKKGYNMKLICKDLSAGQSSPVCTNMPFPCIKDIWMYQQTPLLPDNLYSIK